MATRMDTRMDTLAQVATNEYWNIHISRKLIKGGFGELMLRRSLVELILIVELFEAIAQRSIQYMNKFSWNDIVRRIPKSIPVHDFAELTSSQFYALQHVFSNQEFRKTYNMSLTIIK